MSDLACPLGDPSRCPVRTSLRDEPSRFHCAAGDCQHACQDFCFESAAGRLANVAEHHAAKLERFMVPFLCSVGIAGAVAFYLIWSMNRSVSALDQHVAAMQQTILVMGQDVRLMSGEMGSIGQATLQMAQQVEGIGDAVRGMEQHTQAMTASTQQMAYQLPHLVQTTAAMTQSMGRLGHDVGAMASPMRLFSGMWP